MNTIDQRTDRDDPLEWEEPEDYLLRIQLGLRPVAYSDKGAHPDKRPCPSWCWINGTDEEHSMEYDRPLEAVHTMGAHASVAASLYRAERTDQGRSVAMATIEPRLEQCGQDAPIINVAFRSRLPEDRYIDELLRLSIDDTEDLIAVLQYLVKTAEKG